MTQLRDRVEGVAQESCHHFWVIAAASGPTSKGHCKRCGATKDFFNSFPEEQPAPKGNSPMDLPEMPEIEFDGAGAANS